jgi:hypothetical protein
MPCKKCGLEHQREYTSEMNVHFQQQSDFDRQAVLLFPKLLVCLECGFTEFTISQSELPLLAKRAEA